MTKKSWGTKDSRTAEKKITLQILINNVEVNNNEEKPLAILIVIKATYLSVYQDCIKQGRVSERHARDGHK